MNEVEHWNDQWAKRITPTGVDFNEEKLKILCDKLWRRPKLANMAKLEIGCGTAFHAASLAAIYPQWYDTYTGIDLSPVAIKKAKGYGLNAEIADILKYNPGHKFDAFLLLDSLEHIEDRDGVARKIKALANENYVIFANIPLYLGNDREFEYPMDIHDVMRFLNLCGFDEFFHEIYGCYGYPYMFFEAINAKNIGSVSSSG